MYLPPPLSLLHDGDIPPKAVCPLTTINVYACLWDATFPILFLKFRRETYLSCPKRDFAGYDAAALASFLQAALY